MLPVIRPVGPEDHAALFALIALFPSPTACPRAAFDELLADKLADPDACVRVCEWDGTLVGYVSGSARTAFYVGGRTAWVDEILVQEHRRGQGIGGRLMAAFEAWATARACRSVALATRSAVPFYERLGYVASASYLKKYLDPVQDRR